MQFEKTTPNIYVFFFVGSDVGQPQMLTDSIRMSDPRAEVVFCTDAKTPTVSGVTRRVEIQGDRNKLMLYRLQAFSQCGVTKPAIYIDTDMLCVRPIDSDELCREHPIRFCSREFYVNAPFNGAFGGLDFGEYDRLPIGVVYPYVACATVMSNSRHWNDLLAILGEIDPKFLLWYGDQEAMKRFAKLNGLNRSDGLPESIYGCLPEAVEFLKNAALIHFKGGARKQLMSNYHKALCADE